MIRIYGICIRALVLEEYVQYSDGSKVLICVSLDRYVLWSVFHRITV
jgi:hypothetical protein